MLIFLIAFSKYPSVWSLSVTEGKGVQDVQNLRLWAYLVCVLRSLSHRQKVFNPLPFSYLKELKNNISNNNNNKKIKPKKLSSLSLSVLGGASHALRWLPSQLKVVIMQKKQLVFTSGMPLLCTSPCLPPLGAIPPNVFVSKSPLSVINKVGFNPLVNGYDDSLGRKHTSLHFNTICRFFSLLHDSFVHMLNDHFLQNTSDWN